MSVEDDARDCLIGAILEHHNVSVTPEELNTLKPSDPEVGSQDDVAWCRVLSSAVTCLIRRDYAASPPDRQKCGELLDEELVRSQSYLVGLAGPKKPKVSSLVMVGGALAAIGAVALAIGSWSKGRRP